MKKQTKITALLLSAALVAFSAISCGETAEKETKDTVKIVDNGVTSYKIVRSDTSDVGGAGAARIRSILEEVTDEKMVLMNDFEHEKLGTMRIDTEILVGPTNRDESSMHEREFTYLDYAIDMDTTRLSLTGGSSQALVMAAEYIGENFVDKDTKTVAIPKGQVVEYFHDYPIDSITIGGRDISEYVIVCANGDTRATSFKDSLYVPYGKSLRVELPGYEDVSECEIILSSAKDERYTDVFAELDSFSYMYKVEGTKVYIGTNGTLSDDLAYEMFMSDMFGGDISALKGEVKITDCEKIDAIPHSEALELTDDVLSEIDAKADALKDTIMNAPNMEIPDGANVYYVSPNGDDANDGKTPETALKSLTAVNNIKFPEGSFVLFERGGLWRGQIAAKAGVTYSAYGEGEKPKLYGGHEDGANPNKWFLMEGTDNIWIYADSMIDSGTLVFNHGENVAYKEIPSYIGGKFVKRSATDEEFDIIEALDVDLDFFHKADSILHEGKYPASGNAVGEIYLRCDAGNPGEVFDSIEFVPRRNGFAIGGDNITIDNFTIKYIGAHGVGSGTRTGLKVTNCELGWIGGGIQSYAANGNTNQSATRFGNAIEIYGGCDDFDVNHCYIYQVYDAGITHQYKSESSKPVKQEKVKYWKNLVENCVYSIEYFLNSSDNPEQSMYNIKMYDNILRYAGFGWGNQRPDKGSPAHIKGWDHHNPAVDFEIYNNIMDRGSNWLVHCGYLEQEFEPKIYGNIFVQYHNGLFGRYGLIPTRVISYGEEMLADERLFDNTFYFINDEYVRTFIGDKGTLSLKFNGMPLYEGDEYIEIHGEKLTSSAELAKITDAFAKAEHTVALISGYIGNEKCESITVGDTVYESVDGFDSTDAVNALLLESFDEAFTENVMKSVNEYFITKDGKLYRIGGFSAQFPYDSAKCEIEGCYVDSKGIVNILTRIVLEDDMISTDRRTFYKATKDENGEYKFTGSYSLPIELAVAYPPLG